MFEIDKIFFLEEIIFIKENWNFEYKGFFPREIIRKMVNLHKEKEYF